MGKSTTKVTLCSNCCTVLECPLAIMKMRNTRKSIKSKELNKVTFCSSARSVESRKQAEYYKSLGLSAGQINHILKCSLDKVETKAEDVEVVTCDRCYKYDRNDCPFSNLESDRCGARLGWRTLTSIKYCSQGKEPGWEEATEHLKSLGMSELEIKTCIEEAKRRGG